MFQTLLFWTKKRFQWAHCFQVTVRSCASETQHLSSQAHTFILVHEVTLGRNMHCSKLILFFSVPYHLLFLLKYFGELSQFTSFQKAIIHTIFHVDIKELP